MYLLVLDCSREQHHTLGNIFCLLSLAKYFQASSTQSCVSVLHTFLWLNNMEIWVYFCTVVNRIGVNMQIMQAYVYHSHFVCAELGRDFNSHSIITTKGFPRKSFPQYLDYFTWPSATMDMGVVCVCVCVAILLGTNMILSHCGFWLTFPSWLKMLSIFLSPVLITSAYDTVLSMTKRHLLVE